MKRKIAKIGGRQKDQQVQVREKVSIEYVELSLTNQDSRIMEPHILRTNFGVVEAASKDAAEFLGKNREEIERHICSMAKGMAWTTRRLFGIEYLRICHPKVDGLIMQYSPEERLRRGELGLN